MSDATRTLIYLIGFPGSGKSTLAAALFEGVACEARSKPFAHIVRPGGIELGARRESFSGTDALGMSVQPLVLPFLAQTDALVVFGEGDRLANERFFLGAASAGWRVDVVLLDTPMSVAAARRAERGSCQAPTWVRGRQTKVRNLDPWVRVRLDGTQPVAALKAQLLREMPAFRALIGSEPC